MAMTTTRTKTRAARIARRDWRGIIFSALAGLILLMTLTGPGGISDLVRPWAGLAEARPGFTPELHRWHSVDISALVSLLLGGSLAALIPSPRRRPLLAQFTLLGLGSLALAVLQPFVATAFMTTVIIGAIVAAAYPAPRALLAFAREGAVSRPLLALGLAATPLLALNAWTNLQLQLGDGSEHAALNHWNGAAALAATLILAGLLSSTKRPGWRALGIITALTYFYLGAAALTIPHHDGSWGVTGGVLALLGGAGFLAATVYEARRQAVPGARQA